MMMNMKYIKVKASFRISLLEQKGNSIFYNNARIELFSELIRSNEALILIFETMVLWDKGWNFAAAQYEQFCEHHSLLILILGTTGCQINFPCFPSAVNHFCFMTTIKWTTFTLISASPSIVKALISSKLDYFIWIHILLLSRGEIGTDNCSRQVQLSAG